MDVVSAGTDLAKAVIGAEDDAAKDLIDIEADRAIAVAQKSADVEQKIADAGHDYEISEHGAAKTLALAANTEQNVLEKAVNGAEETRNTGIAAEENNLTKDLADAEEDRAIAYVDADAAFLTDSASAEVDATGLAADAEAALINDLFGAWSGLVSAATPLLTSAVQSFNNSFHNAYVTAQGGATDQSAISTANRDFNNAAATASGQLTSSSLGALTTLVTNYAAGVADTMNAIAAEGLTEAGALAAAINAYAATVAPAATTLTKTLADNALDWVNHIAGSARVADDAISDAAKTANDSEVAAATTANAESDAFHNFTGSYLGAAVPHETNLINEGRKADKDAWAKLMALATAVVAEDDDLARDELNEARDADTALAPISAGLQAAAAELLSANAVLYAVEDYQATEAVPEQDFLASAGWFSFMNPYNWFGGASDATPDPGYADASLHTSRVAKGMAARRAAIVDLGGTPATKKLNYAIDTVGRLPGQALDHAQDKGIELAIIVFGGGFADDALDVVNGIGKSSARTAGGIATEGVELLGGAGGRDFVLYSKEGIELFSARLMDGSTTLVVTWTDQIARTLPRLLHVQQAAGPGAFNRISGIASDGLEAAIKNGTFDPARAADALGRTFGGSWKVELITRASGIIEVIATQF